MVSLYAAKGSAGKKPAALSAPSSPSVYEGGSLAGLSNMAPWSPDSSGHQKLDITPDYYMGQVYSQPYPGSERDVRPADRKVFHIDVENKTRREIQEIIANLVPTNKEEQLELASLEFYNNYKVPSFIKRFDEPRFLRPIKEKKMPHCGNPDCDGVCMDFECFGQNDRPTKKSIEIQPSAKRILMERVTNNSLFVYGTLLSFAGLLFWIAKTIFSFVEGML